MPETRHPLAVSIGDPSGIGPDIILKAWHSRNDHPLPPFVVIGDAELLARRAKLLALPCNIEAISDFSQPPEDPEAIAVLNPGLSMNGDPGSPSPEDAEATIQAISTGVEAVMAGQASGLVTAPINKKALYGAGFSFPGHTEYLAHLAGEIAATDAPLPVMMLSGPELRTVPVTIHIPLNEVPAMLSSELIIETAEITLDGLRRYFGVEAPTLWISGLNPHAGESGSLGKEDDAVIRPAIETLTSRGHRIVGPLPADAMFHAAARKRYDAALCMYHDQALIPAKTLAFEDAVNVTLGLPFVRTSPDHGTAYDIAGTGKADPSSFVSALFMAERMAANAAKYPEPAA